MQFPVLMNKVDAPKQYLCNTLIHPYKSFIKPITNRQQVHSNTKCKKEKSYNNQANAIVI